MTGETLAEILSGRHEPTSREELHAALDELLDAADEDGGRLDSPAFWAFVAGLARGRGIADEIAGSAAKHMLADGPLTEIPLDDPALGGEAALALARMAQWAMLAAVLRRITAFPGEIVPQQLRAALFIAAADNIVAGRGDFRGGEHFDLLGLRTQRGTEDEAFERAARRRLVGAVYFEAERSKRPLDDVVTEMLNGLPLRTWQDWVRESAKAQRIRPRQVANAPRSAARGKGNPTAYHLTDETRHELLRIARNENPWHPGL